MTLLCWSREEPKVLRGRMEWTGAGIGIPDAAVMSRIFTITNIGNLVKGRDCRTKEGGRNMREVSCAAVTQAVPRPLHPG